MPSAGTFQPISQDRNPFYFEDKATYNYRVENIGIQRLTTLKYLKNLEEAKIIRRLFTDLNSTGDLQKPDKILLDNSNLLHILSLETPEKGTVRETFFCNQLASAGHVVEYGGMKTGDFRIDRKYIIAVGGRDKDFSQIKDTDNGYIAADDIDSGIFRKIPLWAFGFLGSVSNSVSGVSLQTF